MRIFREKNYICSATCEGGINNALTALSGLTQIRAVFYCHFAITPKSRQIYTNNTANRFIYNRLADIFVVPTGIEPVFKV